MKPSIPPEPELNLQPAPRQNNVLHRKLLTAAAILGVLASWWYMGVNHLKKDNPIISTDHDSMTDREILKYAQEGDFWPFILSKHDREYFLSRARQIPEIAPYNLNKLKKIHDAENAKNMQRMISKKLESSEIGRKALHFADLYERKEITREAIQSSEVGKKLFPSPRLESMSNEEILQWIQEDDLLSSLDSQEIGYMSHRIIDILYFQDPNNFDEYQKVLSTLMLIDANRWQKEFSFEEASARIRAEAEAMDMKQKEKKTK